MHKLSIITLILILSAQAANAGDEKSDKKATTRYYLNASAEIQLNNADVNNFNTIGNGMSAANQTGAGLGLEYYRKNRLNIFASAMLLFTYIPNKLIVNYHPANAGFFAKSTNQQYEIKFNNYNVTPILKVGYSIPLANNSSSLDIAIGTGTIIQINGQEKDELKMITVTDDGYQDAAVAISSKWGNYKRSLTAANILISQTTLHTNIANKNFQIGVNYSSYTGGVPYPKDRNKVSVNYLGPNRRDAGLSVHSDKLQAISIFIGIAL